MTDDLSSALKDLPKAQSIVKKTERDLAKIAKQVKSQVKFKIKRPGDGQSRGLSHVCKVSLPRSARTGGQQVLTPAFSVFVCDPGLLPDYDTWHVLD
jgi:hypothetical protein